MRGEAKRIALIGPGRLGQAVTRRLHEAGHEIVAVVGRDLQRTLAATHFIGCTGCESTDLEAVFGAEIVLLALPDDKLAAMAGMLVTGGHIAKTCVLVHFSGLHGADLLRQHASETEVPALSIHPLQSFADAQRGYQALPGVPCSIEGPKELLDLAQHLVQDIGGIPFPIAAQHKARYHAAACMTSNYLATLVATAQQLLVDCGFDAVQAQELLAPLLLTTAHNVAEIGPQAALTGPIARGDLQTVARHLQALPEKTAMPSRLYRVLGEGTVELAQKKGTLPENMAASLLKLLRNT